MSTSALSQFEGIIDMKVTAESGDSVQASSYRMFVQHDKLSASLNGMGPEMKSGKFIFRGDKKLLWIVNDDQKSYLEISTKDVKENESMKDDAAGSPPAKLHRTGNKQKILGYPCEELLVSEDAREIHIWATTKLGNVYEGLAKSFGELGGSPLNDETGWEHQLALMKMFPLRLTTSSSGEVTERQEVTKIEAKKLPASTFEPPKGYKKESLEFDMEKIMQQMKEEMKNNSQDEDSSERHN